MAELRRTRPTGPSLLAPKRLVVFAGSMLLGLTGSFMYARTTETPARTAGAALLFAAAATVSGALLGFLFGVPRVLTKEGAGQGDAGMSVRYAGNTNLEQISDWLTKLLVGATLTQLGPIKDGAGRLFTAMAPALGGRADSAAVAGGIVVYFSGLGFMLGWLATRLFLAQAMSEADEGAGWAAWAAAEQADEAGQPEVARKLRADAMRLLAAAGPTAERYEELRRTLRSGPERTRKMGSALFEARELAHEGNHSREEVRELFLAGAEGERIAAIGMMQGELSLFDVESAVEAIVDSRSAFEQYHALDLVRMAVRAEVLDEAARDRLRGAIESARASKRIPAGSDRDRLSASLLEQL